MSWFRLPILLGIVPINCWESKVLRSEEKEGVNTKKCRKETRGNEGPTVRWHCWKNYTWHLSIGKKELQSIRAGFPIQLACPSERRSLRGWGPCWSGSASTRGGWEDRVKGKRFDESLCESSVTSPKSKKPTKQWFAYPPTSKKNSAIIFSASLLAFTWGFFSALNGNPLSSMTVK